MGSKSRETMKETMLKQSQATAAALPSTAIEARFDRLANLSTPPAAPASGDAPPVRYVSLDDIKDREKDLRGLILEHVIDLALSFDAVGMLQFPIVDQHNTLLAGGHRRAGAALLRDVQEWPLEQVRARFERDAEADPLSDVDLQRIKGAYARHFSKGIVVHVIDTTGMNEDEVKLKIEVIENEKRRDFNKDELAGVVSRLEAAGYKRTEGRPKLGQRVLSVELARIIGKSRATVFRVLKELKDGAPAPKTLSPRSVELAKKASAEMEMKVIVRDVPTKDNKDAGVIVIHYANHRERAVAMRKLGVD